MAPRLAAALGSGRRSDDPQARLWRSIAAGRQYRARRIGQYLDRYTRADGPLPQGLPPRVFAFAILNISPDVLRVLATQARVGTLHFYLPTPTQGYWGDLQTLRQRRREDGAVQLFAEQVQENPLLQAWGAAGRDFMALVGDYEVVHLLAEIAAYADLLDSGRRTLADGGLGDSLLRRMQSDLFHRRGPAADARLPAVNLHDPSLQVHACHTRLRELQVLHDQLRALLDDARFDPPLQPREIAVLSPNIDPYVPYLDAVFGSHGNDDALPYALADASPLASEPLAEVFLALLGLPIARFGLHEILDLLASAPIAEAAGLDEAGLERLRNWLHAAGARWGLDAAHRRQHQAPGDDAYTWRFALDRLLLGHASGADEDIDGVAPWPQLEGSALAALDTLLRLLRVLERHQAALADAMTPVEWRERLLGLLEALIPATPTAPRAQRALDRLRTLIDQFARDAVRAEYAGKVPAEVVRAHFAAVLGDSDTRAPLLTGGISFGRMVPMRLLPFRVICLLGMNDGDFPRRDPAAGLNRLTAELAPSVAGTATVPRARTTASCSCSCSPPRKRCFTSAISVPMRAMAACASRRCWSANCWRALRSTTPPATRSTRWWCGTRCSHSPPPRSVRWATTAPIRAVSVIAGNGGRRWTAWSASGSRWRRGWPVHCRPKRSPCRPACPSTRCAAC